MRAGDGMCTVLGIILLAIRMIDKTAFFKQIVLNEATMEGAFGVER